MHDPGRCRTRGLVLSLLIAISAAACVDDPLGGSGYPEPAGLVVRVGGETVVRVDDQRNVTGAIEIGAAAPVALEIVFLDEDGRAIPTSETYLEATVANEDVAVFLPASPGSFRGTLDGRAVGSTYIIFTLVHGAVGNGVTIDVSPAIQVRVRA